MVPRKGLEPPQYRYRQDLNLVRLPIPPPGQLQPVILSFSASLVKKTNHRAEGTLRKIKAGGCDRRASRTSLGGSEINIGHGN
jgi:hypothetical protein